MSTEPTQQPKPPGYSQHDIAILSAYIECMSSMPTERNCASTEKLYNMIVPAMSEEEQELRRRLSWIRTIRQGLTREYLKAKHKADKTRLRPSIKPLPLP